MKNSLQNVITFVFKYIWLFCAVLIALELAGTIASGVILMKETAQGVMNSVNSEVSGRVQSVLQLLNGLASDDRIKDLDQPLFNRAILTEPYRQSHDLYMIGVTDENINVISSEETQPPETMTSLAYRDYMQDLYNTGETQITDAMVAGADVITMNYTIAVPIINNDQIMGSVFGAIYYDDIDTIMNNHSDDSHSFLLLGQDLKVMSADPSENQIVSFEDIAESTHFFGKDKNDIMNDLNAQKSGYVWEWGERGLSYVLYQNVDLTEWTMVYKVQFQSILLLLLPTLFVKISLYILISSLLYVFGNRYLRRHLASINHLLDEVTQMQKQIFHNEREDYEHFLQITQQGLIDHLTGLSTRAVMINKVEQFLQSDKEQGTIIFLDLDDLKYINDTYGHEAGDAALTHIANVLMQYEKAFGGFIARYGGDEFVFIVPDIIHDKAKEIANKLRSELNTTLHLKEKAITIHASIGIAFYPDHGSNFEELICKADLALYTAKHEGKDCCFIYNSSNNEKIK